MTTFIKLKQSGTTMIEVLIIFSMIGFCLLALTKSQLLVDHGYQDLMIRTQAINQAVNLAELFTAGSSDLQLKQNIDLWQTSNQAQLSDEQVALVTQGNFFSVVMSWMGPGGYPIPCDAQGCVDRESVTLQGWLVTRAR